MRILVVGLGDIARKAYLPTLATNRSLELHLASRNAEVLAEVGDAYRIPHLHASASDALAACKFDAAFVHAATVGHPELVQLLLEAGVPVFVDKPLADTFEEASRLVALSEKAGRLLMVGFNRRYALDYASLRAFAGEFCLMQKNRCGQLDSPRRTIFDDFIHVVDTLLFLTPAAAERVAIETVVSDGLLRSVTIMLRSAGQVAIGSMNRDSGLDEERLDVIGNGRKRSVLDLSERREQSGGVETVVRRPDWKSVSRQRGFEAMCDAFLRGVREGRATASHDILETHRLCEEIVWDAESKPGTG
jgi:virulence factor